MEMKIQSLHLKTMGVILLAFSSCFTPKVKNQNNLLDNKKSEYSDSLKYLNVLVGKKDSTEQTLKFYFDRNNERIHFSINYKNYRTENKTSGIAKLKKSSKFGSESIINTETDELIFVNEYEFYYQKFLLSISLQRKNHKFAKLVCKSKISADNTSLKNRFDFDLLMTTK
jgi:thiol:disulfide interchange protein